MMAGARTDPDVERKSGQARYTMVQARIRPIPGTVALHGTPSTRGTAATSLGPTVRTVPERSIVP